ncbi:hypothetical protein F5884DRAFT_310434 [Xylogone sp. PMI_703]|nr:hypothetical protein F5884DRAFT_310434 [Xylogone sp. PMI_703]
MSSSAGGQMYTLQDIPGKGKGLVAARRILAGTRICSEEPIIRVPETTRDIKTILASIRKQVKRLTPDQRQGFFSLHNIHAKDANISPYLGIFQTNALPIGDQVGEAGIFLDACRINHACDNNAQKNWNESIKKHTVHALRDIEEGMEITICYLGVTNNREARQEALRRKFAFTCCCELCSLPPDQSQESDRRLLEILKLDSLINGNGLMGIVQATLKMLGYVDQQIRLYNEQGPNDAGLPRAFLDAAQIAIANGDLARARILAERAAIGWTILGGDDSHEVLKYRDLSRDPSDHELYGMSMKWKTNVDEVPRELNSDEFEDWLWRRRKQQLPGQLVDLRNQLIFPGFLDLPDENDIDPEFYTSSDGFSYRPRRHWLFLGEIVDFMTLVRLQMELQDVNGKTVPLFFYTDGRGKELNPSLVQKGYTVAVLYAQQHAFLYSEPGIRQEDPATIKIFPFSLHKMLELSDRIQKYSLETNGMRTCHGCNKRTVSLKKCAKCSFFWYCDGACQTVGWNGKGHKLDCKLLKNSDLKGLFSLNWDKFEGYVQFPLNTEIV